MDKNSDLAKVIGEVKKVQRRPESSSSGKLDRAKMVQNSREQFYKNLNIQIKDGTNPQPPSDNKTRPQSSLPKNRSNSREQRGVEGEKGKENKNGFNEEHKYAYYEGIWEELQQKLPWHKTPEEYQKRLDIWSRFDVNGNGILSLAEIDKAMRDILKLPALFALKPVLIRAFYAAKDKVKSSKSYADDYISKGEFRILLKFLRQYYEYWVAFQRVDTDQDRRISYQEFISAKSKLESWGIDMRDPKQTWKEVDRNGGGKILFNEFCDWAIRKNLDLEDDDNDDEDAASDINIPPHQYKTKPNFNLTGSSQQKRVKTAMSVRDQLYELVKENINNPKKLQEICQITTHVKIDFKQLIHQAKIQVMKERQANAQSETTKAEDLVLKRIELSKQLLARLRSIEPVPEYAESLLMSAVYNKTRVLEAHLSSLRTAELRKLALLESDDNNRNAVHFAAAHANLEALELLVAADAHIHMTDKYHRTAMHYAAMNDTSKIIETVFIAFKTLGKPLSVYGQQEENSDSPMKHPPIPTFTPYKGVFDNMPPLKKLTNSKKKSAAKKVIEEVQNEDEEGGLVIEHDDEGFNNEEFKVETEGEGIQSKIEMFLTKKVVEQTANLNEEELLNSKMNKIDSMYIPTGFPDPIDIDPTDDEQLTVGVEQSSVVLNSIVNFRDIRGRTPLHIAAAFNNRASVEALLFLGANPQIEDSYNQRPIDITTDDSIRELLQSKMARTQPPSQYFPIEKVKARAGSVAALAAKKQAQLKASAAGKQFGTSNAQFNSTNASKKSTAAQPLMTTQYPLEVKDLQTILVEKINLTKIGQEQDNYLQYAIKNKAFDTCLYLMTLPNSKIDLLYMNGAGNTALNLAVKTGQVKYVKLVLLKLHNLSPNLEDEDPEDLDPSQYNLKILNQTSLLKNNKGYTPLLSAVEDGKFPVFRLLLDLSHFHDTQSPPPTTQLLPQLMQSSCEKLEESPLLKALRLNQSLELTYSLLHVATSSPVYYEQVCKQVEGVAKKNILHLAVIAKQRDLIEVIVDKIDADKGELRAMKDCKGKRPSDYDQSGQFKENLMTVWDYAKEGNVRKLKQTIESGRFQPDQATLYQQMTPLHIAVKYLQLDIISTLLYDFGIDPSQNPNCQGKTPLDLCSTLQPPVSSKSSAETIRSHVSGLLNKIHTSTKLPNVNLEVKQRRQAEKKRQIQELITLKQLLREKIQERGINLEQFFKNCDTNKDGVFSHTEFEQAFVVLDIDVSKSDIRRFIALADANKDGRVDFKEFNNVLNSADQDLNESEIERAGIINTDVDFDASFEQFDN